MKKIKISMIDIESAFEMSSMDTQCWLDTKNGDIVSINEYTMDSEEIENVSNEIDAHPDRFIKIPEKNSGEEYQGMQEFASTVADTNLREKLEIALDGKGAFRRFKNVLASYPEERQRWFYFKNEKTRQRILEWFEEKEIELSGD